MPRIRVLVVDDAVVVRKIVTDALTGDPGIEVVGSAPNGRVALAKLPQLNPDLVTLDIEMPEMDGLQTLKELRRTYPRLPVIMFSTLTSRGASATLDALAAGASDYVTKPSNVGSVVAAQQRVREELIPKIYSLCWRVAGNASGPPVAADGAGAASRRAPVIAPTLPRLVKRPRPLVQAPEAIEVVAIGVSTGGPNALAAILPRFPKDFPVPILIVQHMPPLFTKLLADRLNAESAIGVREGGAGQVVEPGHAYIAPGNFHLQLRREGGALRLATNQGPPENSCRPAVDVLFRSVAECCPGGALAVVLTGMGQDGLRGCECISEAGGEILAQDQATSVVWGMPGFVANAGLADRVVPLDQVAPEVMRRVSQRRGDTRVTAPVAVPRIFSRS